LSELERRTKEQVAKATVNGGMLEDWDFSIDVIDRLTAFRILIS